MQEHIKERLERTIELAASSYYEVAVLLYNEVRSKDPRAEVISSLVRSMGELYRQLERYLPAPTPTDNDYRIEVEVVDPRAQGKAQGG